MVIHYSRLHLENQVSHRKSTGWQAACRHGHCIVGCTATFVTISCAACGEPCGKTVGTLWTRGAIVDSLWTVCGLPLDSQKDIVYNKGAVWIRLMSACGPRAGAPVTQDDL